MLEKIKTLWPFSRRKNELVISDSDKEINLDDDLDMSQITDLTLQKIICAKMCDSLKDAESNVHSRFMIVQTVTDFLESNEKIRANFGEFVGYHFGIINHNKSMVDTAMSNLERFHAGDLDKIASSARGMYVSIWYNIALANLQLIEDSMIHLESLENNLVESELTKHGGERFFLKRGVMH